MPPGLQASLQGTHKRRPLAALNGPAVAAGPKGKTSAACPEARRSGAKAAMPSGPAAMPAGEPSLLELLRDAARRSGVAAAPASEPNSPLKLLRKAGAESGSALR